MTLQPTHLHLSLKQAGKSDYEVQKPMKERHGYDAKHVKFIFHIH